MLAAPVDPVPQVVASMSTAPAGSRQPGYSPSRPEAYDIGGRRGEPPLLTASRLTPYRERTHTHTADHHALTGA